MKIRHVDFSPDEFLVGVAGMPADEIGVYWVICCLIYSSGHAIPVDDERLKRLAGVSHQRLPHIVKSLVEARHKLHLEGGLLSSKRVTNELARAELRVSKARANGELGGRPSNKNNDMEKPDGLVADKLTTNHQPPTSREEANASSNMRDDEFRDWYAQYPRKVDPGRAAKAYRVARKLASAADLLAGALRYSAECDGKETQFVKHPSTWLNARSWENEPPPPEQPRPVNGKSRPTIGGPASNLFAGAAIALERRELERQAHYRAGDDPAEPLLDG